MKRIILPAVIVLGTMIISIIVYDLNIKFIHARTAHTVIAFISAILMFISIWLGAMIANTISFLKGAEFWERVIVCLITPLAWSGKVLYGFVGIYSPSEFAFLLVHHIILGCPVVAVLCMGISELWCRKILKKRASDKSIKIFALKNTVLLITGLCLTVLMLWNGGHAYYFFYMDIYTKIFG